jgi:hypothetical protein
MLRLSYDRVVAYHPYRTFQPWDLGGVKILLVDHANALAEDYAAVARLTKALERTLLRECEETGILAREDNHYGFTVATTDDEGRSVYYQLRFSDGSASVWVMPYEYGLALEKGG